MVKRDINKLKEEIYWLCLDGLSFFSAIIMLSLPATYLYNKELKEACKKAKKERIRRIIQSIKKVGIKSTLLLFGIKYHQLYNLLRKYSLKKYGKAYPPRKLAELEG